MGAATWGISPESGGRSPSVRAATATDVMPTAVTRPFSITNTKLNICYAPFRCTTADVALRQSLRDVSAVHRCAHIAHCMNTRLPSFRSRYCQ